MSEFKDTLKRVLMPINKEGYNIILIVFVCAFLFSLISEFLGWLVFMGVLFCVYFFRDPERVVPSGENLIVAPADGKVDFVGFANPPKELKLNTKTKWTRVSIFLNVFNVHIQRIPISGTITECHYREGKFANVAIDKYSKNNERQACVVETKNGIEIPFVQIAGMIARRIVCNLSVNKKVQTGEKYGIIKFGSRVDLYLPKDIEPKVKVGQTMIGGETVIADISQKYKPKKKIIKKTIIKKVSKNAFKKSVRKAQMKKTNKKTLNK